MIFHKVLKILENIDKEAIKACIIDIKMAYMYPFTKSHLPNSNWISVFGHPHDHPLTALQIGDQY